MNITFTTPITIGDLANRITISSMQLKSLSFNLAPSKGAPNVLVSITLTDPVSGYDAHYVYEDDTTVPAFWNNSGALECGCGCGHPWPLHLMQRLMNDGKLPAGTISSAVSQP